MKKFGLVGGIGPASTLDYYKGITEGYRVRTASDNYPQMIIDSLNLAEMYAYVSNKQWDMFINRLVGSIKNLAAGGAEFAAMAANTAHIVFDEVNSQSPLPLISIVDETCKYAQSKNCKSVVIFGTAFTMSSGLYSNAFAKYGIDAFVPTADEQKAIHNIIFPNLQEGIVLPEDKRTILQIAKRMIAEKNADALILGCTELPLIIQENDLDVLLLDTTQIHIDAILNDMLA
ncbi:aspartate/glutamate racemase family protein [Sporolituus thermophilus]|uniref:Aspartate racemase n=1 Tax=Sporolituus thermophilus DSM 23256 TaxID=1123285 RepID=A0A1G7ILX4_9FIRM|nr:amino acid racemase [Sporolituus thermophilus]SDF13701.1 aspartate racemase [Sporolituus thermophilus DSM 23256]